ncbi:MAG: heparinase II/III family protein, partial [Planctomycetes bacterium]|nr:heparinase II/III family protein [Planctomycetota bacterium]
MRSCLFAAIGCLAVVSSCGAAGVPKIPPADAILNGLRSEHPRLLATPADFEQLKALCGANKHARDWLASLTREAESLLTSAPVKYEIPDGKRLLAVSRRAKDRVLLLGLVYRLTGDARFSERLWRELDTVTRFKDWNPSHFLDTAEMTFAVAVGYDWLHDVWTEQQREQLRRAIVKLGLNQGLPVYEKQAWWARAIHNWNQVCNGGMAAGALAIADEEPALAREVLHAAVTSLPRAMNEFRPDGGWGEGPGYWRYATEYNVYMLATLRTALGTDFGLSQMPGFSATGNFPLYFTGPTGETFNYADAHSGWHGAPQLFWLATTFDNPAWAAAQRAHAHDRPSPLDLLWGAPWLTRDAPRQSLPLDWHFQRVSVVFLRGAWNDANATYVGFKGGDNRVNHGHLDLGSFVLEALGQRWIADPGPDNYNLPGYFGSQRWSYYRCRAEGHNTLVINPEPAPDQH